MSRDELITLLADLLARKAIASGEAARLLDLFDAGELTPEDLPTSAPPKDDKAGWLAAFALLLLMLNGNATQSLPAFKRQQGATMLRNAFSLQVTQLAQQVAGGSITVRVWQEGMQNALANYTRQMAIGGAGTLPDAALQAVIEESLAEQWPFLERFSLEILTRQQAGRSLSALAIAARSRQYGGVATAAYWHGEEDAQTQGRDGFVVYYESRDDPLVCGPCLGAQNGGPYLPGTNYPRPGQVCVARGYCRCLLRFEYDPDMFDRLSGTPRRRAA